MQTIIFYADVAQLAEQLICNQQVIGSSPIIGLRPWKSSEAHEATSVFGHVKKGIVLLKNIPQ